MPSSGLALRALGSLNTRVLLEMASTPVSAAQPEEKARSRRNTVTPLVTSAGTVGPCPAVPSLNDFASPTTSMMPMVAMKNRVGVVNTRPVSRTPRRLTTMRMNSTPEGQLDPVRGQVFEGRSQRGDARGGADGHGQDVIDEEP